MTGSPIQRLLDAVDALDLDAAIALAAPQARLMTVDGRQAHGREAVLKLLADFLAGVRSVQHRITSLWHEDDVWLAEVEGMYELQDGFQTGWLPRMFVLREGPEGILDLRVYGAHEQPLQHSEPDVERTVADERGIRIGERWIPPL